MEIQIPEATKDNGKKYFELLAYLDNNFDHQHINILFDKDKNPEKTVVTVLYKGKYAVGYGKNLEEAVEEIQSKVCLN
mgnify:FL=1